MRMRSVISLALMVALGGAASAAEGRIPLLSLSGPPYIITQPGNYILTRNVGSTTGFIVQIMTDDVTLDLGGHTISGSPGYDAPAIFVWPSPATRQITIKNGRVNYGSQGVSAGGERMRIRLEGLDITGSLSGISINADQADVIDCHVHDLAAPSGGSAGAGIDVVSYGGRILDNLIQNVPGNGIAVSGFRAGEIRRNVVRNFGSFVPAGSGILVQDIFLDPLHTGGAVIADNTVSGLPAGVDDSGISILSPANLVTGNVATHNGNDGIFVWGSENRIERNVTNRNGGEGVGFALAQARNTLVGNQSQGNTGCGFAFNGGVGLIFRDNTLGNNTAGNLCGGAGINAGGNYCDLVICP